jgi:hypothetical protein
MRRIGRSFALSALAAVSLVHALAAAGAAEPDAALRAKSPDAATIAAMAAHGRVRVVVSYRVAAAGEASASSDAAAIAANRAAQEAILRDHFGPPAGLSRPDRALRRLAITPAFAIDASADEIAALARDPRVLGITLDRPRPPLPR